MEKKQNAKKVVKKPEDDLDEINLDQLREALSTIAPPYISPRKKWGPKLSPINENGVLEEDVKMMPSTSNGNSNSNLKKILCFWQPQQKKAKKKKAPKKQPGDQSPDSSKEKSNKARSPGKKDQSGNAQNPSNSSANASHRQAPNPSSAMKTKNNDNGDGTNAVIGFKTVSFNGKRKNVNYDNVNDENGKKLGSILSCLRDINDQMKSVTNKQDDISKQIKANGMTPKALGNEISQQLEPYLKVMVDKVAEESYKNLDSMIDKKLSEEENKLAGIVANQNQIDPNVLANELATLIKPSMDNAFNELFNTTVIPKTEKALNSMIEQVDAAANERSAYYNKERNTFMKTLKVKQEVAPRYNINRSIVQKFLSVVKKSEDVISKSRVCLLKHLDELPEKEITIIDYIKWSIERGNIPKAFDMALTAVDLELVLFVCRNISMPLDELFQSASMTPPIVFSLMQQLSFDLSNSTGMKHKYLDAAVRNLNTSDKGYKKRVKFILNHVDKEIEAFLNQDPQNPFCCRIESLQLIVKTKISSMA